MDDPREGGEGDAHATSPTRCGTIWRGCLAGISRSRDVTAANDATRNPVFIDNNVGQIQLVG